MSLLTLFSIIVLLYYMNVEGKIQVGKFLPIGSSFLISFAFPLTPTSLNIIATIYVCIYLSICISAEVLEITAMRVLKRQMNQARFKL